MARKWISFNYDVTNAEFASIPQPHLDALANAMKMYGKSAAGGFIVKHFAQGFMTLKATNRTQGRCCFVTRQEPNGDETLIALLFYKKETQKAPQWVIEKVLARKAGL